MSHFENQPNNDMTINESNLNTFSKSETDMKAENISCEKTKSNNPPQNEVLHANKQNNPPENININESDKGLKKE